MSDEDFDYFDFQVRQDVDRDDPTYRAALAEFAETFADPLYRSYPECAPGAPEPPKVDLWYVSLPHQCDAWEIAADLPRAKAEAALQRFIYRAQDALNALREGREIGGDAW